MTGISNQSREDELSGQICSAELASNQLLFVDRLVGVNRSLGLTGNKLLYPVRREAISPAPEGAKYTANIFRLRPVITPCAAGQTFSVAQRTVGSCKKASSPGPQVPAATSNNGRKNRGGRSTVCELIMISITLTDKPLWSAKKSSNAVHR